MADFFLAGNLSESSDANITRESGNTVTVAGQIFVSPGTSAVIDQDLLCSAIEVRGGATPETAAELTIGSDDPTGDAPEFGGLVKCLFASGWGQRAGSINTEGHCRLNIYNTVSKTRGLGPGLGMYNPTQTQSNVVMRLCNSTFLNYRDAGYSILGGGEPMIAPNTLLQDVQFFGVETVWFNGDPDPASKNVTISSGALGAAVASAFATFRNFDSDWYGMQQSPCGLTLVDSKIRKGLKANQARNQLRTIVLKKTVTTSLTASAAPRLVVISAAGLILLDTTAALEDPIGNEVTWAEITRNINAGSDTIPVDGLTELTARAGWSITNHLPIKVVTVGYALQTLNSDITAATLALTTDAAKEKFTLKGIISDDASVTGTAAEAALLNHISIALVGGGTSVSVTTTASASLQEIYNRWKWLRLTTLDTAILQAAEDLINITGEGTFVVTGSIAATGDLQGGGTVVKASATGTITATGTIGVPITDSAGAHIKVADADGQLASIQVWVIDGTGTVTYDSGFNSLVASVGVTVPVGSAMRSYIQPYGGKAKIVNTPVVSADVLITSTPEIFVDTALDTVVRDTIEAEFSSVSEGGVVYVEIGSDLGDYTPAQVLNAMHYFIVRRGFLFAGGALAANSVGAVELIDGGFKVFVPSFKGRAKATLDGTTTPTLEIRVPLYIEDDTGIPGNQIFVRNINGVAVVYALWTQASAAITGPDKDDITNRIEQSTILAKEATLAAKASQSSLDTLVGTNQTEHDATQSAIAALPAPLTTEQTQAASTAALVAYDGVVPADLIGLATATNVSAAQVAILANVDAIPTNPLLATDYTAPDNTAVQAALTVATDKIDAVQAAALAIKVQTDTIAPAPTAAEIRTELEMSGGKVHIAAQKAAAAWLNTL